MGRDNRSQIPWTHIFKDKLKGVLCITDVQHKTIRESTL